MVRERLLEAAGEIFARRGFHKATVREICSKAGANVASVHYYFGDKRQIYEAVLRHAHRYALEKYPPDPAAAAELPPVERLRAFVQAFLLRILDDGRPSWHGRLLAREMMDPTGALDKLVEEEIRPRYEEICDIVQELLGDDGERQVTRLCVRSILGQCLFYRHSQPVLARLEPEQRYRREDITRLADHIVAFSLAALERLADSRPGEPGAEEH